jgi:hypothetical protein
LVMPIGDAALGILDQRFVRRLRQPRADRIQPKIVKSKLSR